MMSDESINEEESMNEQDPVSLFHLYLEANDLREARKLIRKHKEIQRLNPKELNTQYPLTNYKFTSRNGVLSIDSTKALNNKVSFEQQQTDFNNEIDEFKSSQRIINNQILERLMNLERKNKILTNALNQQSIVINQIVSVINGQ